MEQTKDVDLGSFFGGSEFIIITGLVENVEDYLALAQLYADEDLSKRVAFFAKIEAELITSPDSEFRFHSGNPQVTTQH